MTWEPTTQTPGRNWKLATYRSQRTKSRLCPLVQTPHANIWTSWWRFVLDSLAHPTTPAPYRGSSWLHQNSCACQKSSVSLASSHSTMTLDQVGLQSVKREHHSCIHPRWVRATDLEHWRHWAGVIWRVCVGANKWGRQPVGTSEEAEQQDVPTCLTTRKTVWKSMTRL